MEININRFGMFAGGINLMIGGTRDFKGAYPTKEDAYDAAVKLAEPGQKKFLKWVQIFDRRIEKVVEYSVDVYGKLKEKEGGCLAHQ